MIDVLFQRRSSQYRCSMEFLFASFSYPFLFVSKSDTCQMDFRFFARPRYGTYRIVASESWVEVTVPSEISKFEFYYSKIYSAVRYKSE
jgi:hypothetical protein